LQLPCHWAFPVSRPLSTQEAEFDGKVLWFFTRRSSAKVDEIGRNAKVNVAYASKERNVYLSVAGTAELVAEQALIDAFWNDAMKAFFPGGRTDPDLVLLKVNVHTVEYWDGPSTLLGKAIAFVVSRVRKDDSAMGDSGQLRMAPAGRKAGRAAAKPVRATTRTAEGRKLAGDGPVPKKAAKKTAKKATGKPAKKTAAKTAGTGRKPAARR
jgi:general stress protein 26